MLSHLFYNRNFDIQDFDYCLEQAKILVFPELSNNQYYGIYAEQTPKDSKVLYDVYKTIMHEFNKDSENWNVHKGEHSLVASDVVVEIKKGV